MGCGQFLNGIALGCGGNLGGIREVHIARFDDVAELVVADGVVTAVALRDSVRFKNYAMRREGGQFTVTSVEDADGRLAYYESDIELYFSRLDTAKRLEIESLAQDYLMVIVTDANGQMWLFGREGGVELVTVDGTTGKARTDSNGYTIVLRDECSGLPIEVAHLAPWDFSAGDFNNDFATGIFD